MKSPTKCVSFVSERKKVMPSPNYLLPENVKVLPRTVDTFEKIQNDRSLSCVLPRPSDTAGAVLRHAIECFSKFHSRFKPMTFKFGITHCPYFRWNNKMYGYKTGPERFDRMIALYCAENPHGPAFLEAALIDRFGSPMAKKTQSKAK